MRARSLFCVSLLLFPVIAAADADIRVEGHANGSAVDTFGTPVGSALLDGFYFRYGPPLGNSSGTDHHVYTLGIEPRQPNVATIRSTFADKGTDDDFAYVSSFHTRSDSGIVNGTFESDGKCLSTCIGPIPRPSPDHAFVIRNFHFQVDGGDDAHIESFNIRERDGEMKVFFHLDEGGVFANPTPKFIVRVDYSFLPRSMWKDRGTVAVDPDEDAHSTDQAQIPAGESVISGFGMQFANGDHHLREVSVMTPDDGRVQVFWNDKNGDDPFKWVVDWTVLEAHTGESGPGGPGNGIGGGAPGGGVRDADLPGEG